MGVATKEGKEPKKTITPFFHFQFRGTLPKWAGSVFQGQLEKNL